MAHDSTLTRLNELRESLSPDVGEDALSQWWELVEQITSDIECDPRASNHDRQLVANLREGVSALIRDIREGAPSPFDSKAQVSASALHSSIAKRTTGVDGWPKG